MIGLRHPPQPLGPSEAAAWWFEEAGRLLAALKEYGTHDSNCAMVSEEGDYIWHWNADKTKMIQPDCTCGLSVALGESK